MKYGLLLLFCYWSAVQAQKIPTIEEKTAGYTRYAGYLNFYWDDLAGKIWLEVSKLDSEMLYQTSLPAGLGSNDIGLDRGLLGNTSIVKFSRVGRKILLVQPNYNYRALSTDPEEKRAVEQSFAQSVLWGFQVEAESHGAILVDATDFIVRDALHVASRLHSQHQGEFALDKSRSALYLPRTKNFLLNTELEATVTFVDNGGDEGNFVQQVTPAPGAITLRVHHSFVQLPGPGYQPRSFDPRSSYSPISFYDFSTPVTEPIQKYFICRHRLIKQDPTADLSPPVDPIIYYVDAGAPEPIRSALVEGASWWNQAFEAAGFKNAFQVKILPDSVDPMDVRYNVITWVHRATRGWSTGDAVVDPRTGEIIKGIVILGSLRVRQDYLIASGLLAPFASGLPADNKMMTMALARIRQLAAHEVGHTLGLEHNFAASASDRASVMDYPHPLVRLDAAGNIDLQNAYAKNIGDWDKVSIDWGYRQFAPGTDEEAALGAILKDAQIKGLQFISDRDARDPGGLHPQAHLWDNGADAVDELQQVLKVREKALAQFGENNIRPGNAMAFLEDVLVPIYLFHRYQLEAVTKMVGGMYYSYAIRGDGQVVTRPLSRDQQLRALQAVLDCLDPKLLAIPETISRLIPPRPADYEYNRELFNRRTGLAFDPLAAAETAADFPLSFLFNAPRLDRMIQYKTRTGGLGADEMIAVLINRTWKSPRLQGFDQLIQLQNEQLVLSYLLNTSVNDNASFAARAFAQVGLVEIKAYAEQQLKAQPDQTYKAHLLLALERIKSPDKAKPSQQHQAMPPGMPIGDEDWDQ
jgi:Met-zincin/Domain of unknown function (DUF5117)